MFGSVMAGVAGGLPRLLGIVWFQVTFGSQYTGTVGLADRMRSVTRCIAAWYFLSKLGQPPGKQVRKSDPGHGSFSTSMPSTAGLPWTFVASAARAVPRWSSTPFLLDQTSS